MPCDHWKENETENSSATGEPSFITKYYFAAIVKHFEKLLEELNLDDKQNRLRLELRNLLDIFKSCYTESQRKTQKIFELKATNAVEQLKIKTSNSEQDELVKGLRDAINDLQRDLDVVNRQRKELLEELEGLRKGVETVDKATETHDDDAESPRTLTRKKDYKIFQNLVEGLMKAKKTDEKPVGEELSEKKSVETKPDDISGAKFLRNDLDILVADLKLTRQKVIDLKSELCQRDVVIKKCDENLSFSEKMLKESRNNVEEVKRPLEKSLKTCQAELQKNKQKYENIYKNLQAALELNSKLSKEVESKELAIVDLKAKLKVLVSERDSNEKKANIFEEHLARSQGKIEILLQEIECLKCNVKGQKKEITALKNIGDTIQPDEEKIDAGAQERFVENLKNQIMLREKKILSVGNELQETIETLQSVKRAQDKFKNDRIFLESEVENLKELLRDRSEDLKQQKEKVKTHEKERNKMKKELYSWVKKYQQVTEKKNKFHDLYNRKKVENGELGKENMILVKRQQYLVKILKEKDKEIEKLLRWKEYNI